MLHFGGVSIMFVFTLTAIAMSLVLHSPHFHVWEYQTEWSFSWKSKKWARFWVKQPIIIVLFMRLFHNTMLQRDILVLYIHFSVWEQLMSLCQQNMLSQYGLHRHTKQILIAFPPVIYILCEIDIHYMPPTSQKGHLCSMSCRAGRSMVSEGSKVSL